ncbi:MAG TPA: KUP/HAK/KT family potassium transporter [Steroidobacteraceae bacterium]|jgi:KUP system potassium uptake protein|nr:KUP/HAK/KT family potassium transporter [Steroidobacteraceae bacterium]
MMQSRRLSLSAVVGALGIVYGDIGTSPLYALDATVTVGGRFDSELVLGSLSLILWALTLSVTIKYVSVIMRADNEGEGGILAMFALAQRQLIAGGLWARIVVWLALAGTAFFFCDSLITPAVTVLSAVEGMEVLDPSFKSTVIPITVGVIVALFAYQRRGTARVGSLFGPVMVVWFVVLGVTGVAAIRRDPVVLAAINPLYGIELLMHRPGVGFAIIGAVFLAITGGEALYADMGHFGKEPVRIAWFALVFPALILNYFGQGALLLSQGKYLPQALYLMVPAAALPWMVTLATAASVIASQAVITGAFSMARQAVQLDLLPRIRVLQTSATEHGQIYVPVVNWLVFIAVIAFVIGFGSSAALTGAYGAAVVGTMLVTTILGSFVALTQWSWSKWSVASLFGLLMIVDSIFVLGNMTKVPSGGWIPLTLAAILFTVFMTWRSGRLELRAALARMAVPRAELPKLIAGTYRVHGTGVFLASDPHLIPSALIRNVEHNGVAHERLIILNVEVMRTPRQDPVHRVEVEEALPGVYLVHARFGFMETPDVGEALKSCRARGLRVFAEDSSFFVGQHVVRARPLPGWKGLQRRLFAWMQRHSTQAAEFFRMPFRGVVVLNTVVEI